MSEQISFPFGRALGSYTSAQLALLTPDDIYSVADEALLVTLKEDRRIERKRAPLHGEEMGEYYSMWSNTAPDGGLMVIGQENNGTFSGCLRLAHTELNALEKAGVIHCPDAHIETRRVSVTRADEQADFVLLVRVSYHSRKVVKTVKGKAYWRIADEKKEVPRDQLRELEIAKGEVDLEQESVALIYPDDFDGPLIRQFVEAVIRFRKLTEQHPDTEILTQLRLGKIRNGGFSPNVACALLFARDPVMFFPGCRVRLLRFDGDVEQTGKSYNAVKDIPVEGHIPHLIVETAKQLKGQLREFSTLGDDGRFYSATEYPEEAWYEAIVNACVHRSYALKNIPIFVKMFDDRLVIESPGGFPPNVTPETIYETHSPRNPHLMNALFYLAFVKAHNEGTRRMRDTMNARDLPRPEFFQTTVHAGFNSVRVTLRNNIKLRKQWIESEAGRLIGPEALKDLTLMERRILNYIGDYGKINVTQCQKLGGASGIRWQRAKKILTNMVERGLLAHHHSGEIVRDSHQYYTVPGRASGDT